MIREKTGSGVKSYRMGRKIAGRVVYEVHSFLVGETLIDTGASWTRDEFAAALSGKKIGIIVNTHHHEDHVGANRLLKKQHGAEIFAHAGALPELESPKNLRLRFYQRSVWGWPEPSSGTQVGRCVPAGGGELDVIDTPGHCDSHICLHDKNNGLLFTGDLFCGRKFKYLRLEENFNLILESLCKLRELDFETLFCSLFGRIEDGKESLKKKIDFMEELSGKVKSLSEKGANPEAISRQLLGAEGAMKLISGGHYSLRNTVDSIISGMSPLELREKEKRD